VNATAAQTSLKQWVAELAGAGLLYRHEGEARVDELPQIMEDHPDQAVFVERVRDCDFPFLANAFSSTEMCAQAWCYNPGTGTVLIPGQNVIMLDPNITQEHPPFSMTKIGFDCTIPLDRDRDASAPATVSPPIAQPAPVEPLDADFEFTRGDGGPRS
jgi:hypothetical protein